VYFVNSALYFFSEKCKNNFMGRKNKYATEAERNQARSLGAQNRWRGKTKEQIREETRPAWSAGGRPLGAKDSSPRQRKSLAQGVPGARFAGTAASKPDAG
jgi:hypothetical protein